MFPPTTVAAGPATATSDAPSPTSTSFIPPYGSEQWNSFIGIVTAIVGNVLISFALNTQRYAHIRLEREWQEKERQRKRRSASYRSLSGAKRYRDEPRTDDAASEDDPLLAAPPSRKSTGGPRPGLSPVQEEDGVEEEAYKQKSYLKSPYWWAGIIMMTCGEAGNFLAYGFAPASIVSPLGVVALISNCIIAPFMLKEPFRARDALGVLVAVGGAVTVVLSASDNNPKLGPDEIWSLISTWEFETYFGITVAVIIALVIASNRFGDKNILIDLGLVGLFGELPRGKKLLLALHTHVQQVAIRRSPLKAWRLCFHTHFGAPSRFPLRICLSLFWSALQSCRLSISIGLCNVLMRHRSSPCSLSSSHSLSS